MFGLRHGKEGVLYGALVDIGSGTLGIAIVVSDIRKKLPTIIYKNRITMRVADTTGEGEENMRRVREMLFSASLILSQEGYEALKKTDPHAKIKELCVTCAAPWSHTVAKNVEHTEEEPFKVTEQALSDLIEAAEDQILTVFRGSKKDEANPFSIVERATTHITLNEYPVIDPLHMEGTALRLAHVVGMMPEKIMESVKELQDKLFPTTRLHTHTAMLSSYSVIRDLFPRSQSFAIVNVTAEATEFGIVEEGMLMDTSFIPWGTHKFTRDVGKGSGRPGADVLTAIKAYGEGTGTEDAALKEEGAPYTHAVIEGLSHILETRALPTQFIVTAHHPYQNILTALITDAGEAVLKKKPEVLSIQGNLIEKVASGASEDAYLALAARFFHKLHAEEERR